MIIHNVEQWSEEWFDLRKSKLTASHAQAIWNGKKWLDTYVLTMLSEIYSSGERYHHTNVHIDRWNNLEDQARQIYEMQTWNKTSEVWFIEYSEFVGWSPDGLVWDDGGIEIKCKQDKDHYKLLLYWDKCIESSYIRQMQMYLLITGRKRRDFVSYNPNYKKPLFIHRVLPDEEKHKQLLDWFEKWRNLILEIQSKSAWL